MQTRQPTYLDPKANDLALFQAQLTAANLDPLLSANLGNEVPLRGRLLWWRLWKVCEEYKTVGLILMGSLPVAKQLTPIHNLRFP